MADEQNLTIKIPERIYVGFQQNADDMPLGLVTPDGTDAAAKKRCARIDKWTQNSQLNALSIENQPLVGFRISRALRTSGWYGKSAVIRIEDPRGFEVEINAVNMMMLTDENTIQNGEILAECVWGRDNGEMLLLPVNSEPYKIAAENTRRSNTKTSIRAVSIGDRVVTSTGIEGIYLGSMYPVLMTSTFHVPDNNRLATDDKKRRIIYTEYEDGTSEIIGNSSLAVSEIINKVENPMTLSEARDFISQKSLNSGARIIDRSIRGYYKSGCGYSVNAFSFNRVELISTTETSIKERFREYGNFKCPLVVARHIDGRLISLCYENFLGEGRAQIRRYFYSMTITGNDFTAYYLDETKFRQGIVHGTSNTFFTIPETDIVEIFLVKFFLVDTKTGEEFAILR